MKNDKIDTASKMNESISLGINSETGQADARSSAAATAAPDSAAPTSPIENRDEAFAAAIGKSIKEAISEKKEDKKKYTGLTLEDLYGMATLGAKKMNYDLDFTDKAQRDAIVAKREENPGPWNCGFIGFIFRLILAPFSLFIPNASFSDILPGRLAVPDGIPVSIPHKLAIQDVALMPMGEAGNCKVSKENLVCAHPIEQTMYYDKINFNGKELDYGRIKGELANEYGVSSSSKVVSMLVDLAMYSATSRHAVSHDILREKIEKYHDETLDDCKKAFEKAAASPAQPVAQAPAPMQAAPAPAPAPAQEVYKCAPLEQDMAFNRETEEELNASLETLLRQNMEASKTAPEQEEDPLQQFHNLRRQMSSNNSDSSAPKV